MSTINLLTDNPAFDYDPELYIRLIPVGNIDPRLIYFRVRNNTRVGIRFISSYGIEFRTCNVPDIDGDILYLQGYEANTFEKILCIKRKAFISILNSVIEFNIINSPLFSNNWVNDFDTSCKQCGIIHSIFDESMYCDTCKGELHACYNCDSEDANILFNGVYYCDNCIDITYCNNCFTYAPVRQKLFSVPSDYHGDTKRINLCSDCYPLPLTLGREHHYHYVPEVFNFWDIVKDNRVRDVVAKPKKLYMGIEIESCLKQHSHTNLEIKKILDI